MSKSWDELMDQKQVKTSEEETLIQCIASLSSHPKFQNMVPEEIYNKMVEWAWDIRHDQPKVPSFSDTISPEFKS